MESIDIAAVDEVDRGSDDDRPIVSVAAAAVGVDIVVDSFSLFSVRRFVEPSVA